MKQVPNMHSGAQYLTKKGHKGGMEHARGIAPMQGRQGVMPSGGVKNSSMESLGNTKAQGVSQPQGKPHAKVVTASKNMGVGKYL